MGKGEQKKRKVTLWWFNNTESLFILLRRTGSGEGEQKRGTRETKLILFNLHLQLLSAVCVCVVY